MSWIAALAVLCNSVTIMFVTTDIEEVIQILGKTYRYYIMRNSEFRNIALGHEDTNCVAGMCVSIDSQRAQGALYWFIWVCFVGLGWASRVAAARAWRTESYEPRRARQRGTTIQREMGFYGPRPRPRPAPLARRVTRGPRQASTATRIWPRWSSKNTSPGSAPARCVPLTLVRARPRCGEALRSWN